MRMSAKGCDAKVKAWTPAVPCKIPDNIVSSKFATMKVFVPSYERERRPCMEQLLTNEYQRIWWQEKETWDKTSSRKITTKKLLQRSVIRRKPPAAPIVNKFPTKGKKLKTKKKKDTENIQEALKNKDPKDIEETLENKDPNKTKDEVESAKCKEDTQIMK